MFCLKLYSGVQIPMIICLLLCIVQKCLSFDLTYKVEESKNAGTYVGNIAADTNILNTVSTQNRNQVRFTQLQKGMPGSRQLFQVSKKTGKLYTAETLDAEELCKYNKECFQIMDVAVQKAASTIKILEIKVNIIDINDHQPEFPNKQVNIEFNEDVVPGKKILIPNAIDKDVGEINSQIFYELKKYKDEPFSLVVSKNVDGTSKLEINLKEKLDRETKDSYLIQVVAKDGGSPPKESTLHVHITITDVNDNAPIFSNKVYNISIKNEPSETLPILVLSAKDLDLDKNGKVSYHFSSKTSEMAKSHFRLSQDGNLFLHQRFILLQNLDYDLYMEAKDGGNPSLSSITKVQVHLISQKNNAPKIDVNFVSSTKVNTVDIYENIQVGNFIAYVKVSDIDEGQNGEVRCDLHHEKFQLQSLGSKKYEVTVKQPVDREKEEHHDVVISCQDKGSPPLHSNSKFSIQVMDINDVRPQFTKDTFKFFIDENQNSRITLGYINATDPDLGDGGKLTYSIITKNNKHFLPFKITTNGLLSAIMSLDHEFQHTYHFKVFVKDNGTPSLNNTVNVIVEVTDKNDNAPYFTFPSVKPYNLHVTYYPDARNKNITQIKAADSDSQENAFLKYQIIRGNDKQMFTINQYTGFLAFNRQLSQQNAGSYQLDILVKDSGRPVLSATTTLFLTLTISNNTSEMLNVVQLHTEEKVHLNLVIIITVIAVTIAVFITASLSICIIRCNGQSNVAYAQALDPSNRYVGEQRQLMSPSYPGNTWPHPAQPLQINQNPSTNTPITTSRRELTSADALPQKIQPPNEVLSQMYTENISIPPDYFTWRSTVPSQSDADLNWREDSAKDDQKADQSLMKSSVHSGSLNKSDISAPFPQSRNLLEINNQQTSNARPLPPVPNIN